MCAREMRPLSDHLMDVVQQLQISADDRQSYTKDAQDIQNAVMNAMKKHDSFFNDAYRGLSLTGSYLDRSKIKVPDEFDLHVKLELPFDLEVERHPRCPGFVILYAETDYEHPLVTRSGYINRKNLQTWMRDNFTAVIAQIGEVRCRTGHTYRLKYTLHGYGCAHTILATDQNNSSREIWFDFVPAFEFDASEFPTSRKIKFNGSHWFAVPQRSYPPDARSFMVCAPHFEKNVMKNKHKLKDALRLMKGLREANNMFHLTSYMIKGVFLEAIEELPETFWQRSMAVILTKMLGRLLFAMRTRMEFFLAPEVNQLDRLNEHEKKLFCETIHDLLLCFKSLKSFGDPVPYEEVAELFGLA